MKIQYAYWNLIQDKKNFRTVARHNKCSFLQVRKESGSPVWLFKDEFAPQKQNEIFYLYVVYVPD